MKKTIVVNDFKTNFKEFQNSLDLFFNISHKTLKDNSNYKFKKEFVSILHSYSFKVFYGSGDNTVKFKVEVVDSENDIEKIYSLQEFNKLLKEMNTVLNKKVYSEKELIAELNEKFNIDLVLYENKEEVDNFIKKEVISKIVKVKEDKDKSYQKFKDIQMQLVSKIQSHPNFSKIESLQAQLKELMGQLNSDTNKIKEEISFDEHQQLYKEKSKEFKETREIVRKEINSYARKSNPEFIIEKQDNLFIFNEIQCNKFLKQKLNKDIGRELIQTYFLIEYCSKYGFDFHAEDGRSLSYNVEFKNIFEYKEKIQKKLSNNFKVSKILKSVNITLDDINPSPEQKRFIIENIIPNMLGDLKAINDEHKKEELVSFVDKVILFKKENIEIFLDNELNETVIRELIQTLMIEDIIKNFRKEVTNNSIIFDNTTKEIVMYKDRIIVKLNEALSEKSLYERIKYFSDYLDLNTEVTNKIFHNLSATINAIEDPGFFKNDAMFFTMSEKKLVKIDFCEDVCVKLLNKPPHETSLRELSQVYFMNEVIKKSIKIKNRDNMPISLEGFAQIEKYIPKIENFLRINQTEEHFQKSVDIVLRCLNLEENEKEIILFDILTPLKSKLNFESSKILKRLI